MQIAFEDQSHRQGRMFDDRRGWYLAPDRVAYRLLCLCRTLFPRDAICEDNMLGIGSKLPSFDITGVKPGFHLQEENGNNAFETLTERSFPGKWKVIFFYPKDFTFVCPTEIVEFARLSKDFADRDAIVLGGSTDNEFCKLAWRREHKDLHRLAIWQFSDTKGALVDGLGVRSRDGIAHRYTFIIDPENTIQHVYATSLNVGRNPRDTLRVLDAIQTDELCPCNREIGGDTLKIG